MFCFCAGKTYTIIAILAKSAPIPNCCKNSKAMAAMAAMSYGYESPPLTYEKHPSPNPWVLVPNPAACLLQPIPKIPWASQLPSKRNTKRVIPPAWHTILTVCFWHIIWKYIWRIYNTYLYIYIYNYIIIYNIYIYILTFYLSSDVVFGKYYDILNSIWHSFWQVFGPRRASCICRLRYQHGSGPLVPQSRRAGRGVDE